MHGSTTLFAIARRMTLTEDTIRSLIWAAVSMCAIQGAVTYAIVKLLVTGSGLFVRRERDADSDRRGISIAGR